MEYGLLASLLLKDYNFNNFIYMFNFYAHDAIRFSPWNSSLYNSINNIYMYGFDAIKSSNFKGIAQFIHKVVINQNLEFVIMIFYFLLIFISYFRLRINKITRNSFLLILASACALMTSPFGDYHLIIFIF